MGRHALRRRETKKDEAGREKDKRKKEQMRVCRRGKSETSVRGISHFSGWLDISSLRGIPFSVLSQFF